MHSVDYNSPANTLLHSGRRFLYDNMSITGRDTVANNVAERTYLMQNGPTAMPDGLAGHTAGHDFRLVSITRGIWGLAGTANSELSQSVAGNAPRVARRS